MSKLFSLLLGLLLLSVCVHAQAASENAQENESDNILNSELDQQSPGRNARLPRLSEAQFRDRVLDDYRQYVNYLREHPEIAEQERQAFERFQRENEGSTREPMLSQAIGDEAEKLSDDIEGTEFETQQPWWWWRRRFWGGPWWWRRRFFGGPWWW